MIFVHDFFSKAEIEAYREQTNVNTYVIVPALESSDRAAMPVYLQHSLDALYPDVPARGSDTMMWADFCNMGQRFRGFVPAPVNIDRPLLRAYTSGSTGPSKQVIHSAHSIIGVLTNIDRLNSAASLEAAREQARTVLREACRSSGHVELAGVVALNTRQAVEERCREVPPSRNAVQSVAFRVRLRRA